MPEMAWPGDELNPREREAVAALMLDGWKYLYCDGVDFAMQSPDQVNTRDWWRIKRDGSAPPEHVKAGPRSVPRAGAREILARLGPKPEVDVEDRTRRPGWSLGDVRRMAREGYSAAHIHRTTGWGGYWYADLCEPRGA